MNSHISAMARKSAKKKVSHMTLKPVKNGFTSTTHYEPNEVGKASYMGEDSDTSVHPSVSHLVKHVRNTMQGDMGGGATQPTSSVGPMDGNVDSGAGY